jgi:hypothetical protein
VNTSDADQERLRLALAESQGHLDRLNYAARATAALFPMEAGRYQRLSAPEITLLDQMLFRFGKLQDSIGQRLLPAILRAGQEWHEQETFLDKLNRLEKLGAVPSALGWVELRELRHSAMHEYPDDPALNAANLTRIFNRIDDLANALSQARGFASQHFGVAGDTAADPA